MFTKIQIGSSLILLSAFFACQPSSDTKTASSENGSEYVLDRTILPIAPPPVVSITEEDARNAQRPAPWEVKAPEGAPNVVIVMIDDIGFGMSSAFGGPIKMPFAEKLAQRGLRYNRFHTTALCSPTRTALLTGRNHHSNNMAGITEIATAFPGNTGVRPQSMAQTAMILKLNGFNTAQFGKNHETPAWQIHASGSFENWPTGQGFEKFYGFMGGETNQFYPGVWDGTSRVEVPVEDPNYHFTNDMTDKAIQWMSSQHSMTPDKPFYMYFAPGACHAPHHPPASYVNKYKGQFNDGWDVMRKKTLERQIAMGIVPKGTTLAPKDSFIKDWDELSAVEQKVFARQMEVYAGFAEHTDAQIQRLHEYLESIGELEKTVFIYIIGDNGTSAEGTANGLFNENTYFNAIPETIEELEKQLPKFGTRASYGHFAAGWAVAGNTPFKWTKQVAGDFGGTRNGVIIDYPALISEKDKGTIRSQFSHVIDIAPTILELCKVPQPTSVNGVKQEPIQGFSMVESIKNAAAPEFHKRQYFEIIANRGIYSEGWMARTVHKAPWEIKPKGTVAQDKWELFNVAEDFSMSTNVADKYPEKLKELQELFKEEAIKFHVFPLDDRSLERLDPAQAGRPDAMGGRTKMTVYSGMGGMQENSFINTKNRSFKMTAYIETPANASGVLLAAGGAFGGYSLYLHKGVPYYTYNWVGKAQYHVSGKPLTTGKHVIEMTFTYDGGGTGKGGTAVIKVDGVEVGKGRIEHTAANIISLDEGADVGMDEALNVSALYPVGKANAFKGKIDKIEIELL
ncbi:MAG: arylsulfatase [Cytophagaceae bacterium]|jgi:arylsulfatase|nr:arylsulfatase [Cytophagaceae bacterium]